MEFLKLLFIAITNPIYNFGLYIVETFVYGKYGWWWRLNMLYFLSYLAESPFAVIKREGPRAPVHLQNLIYGETPCLTLQKILQEIPITEKDHFIDLGCGRGFNVCFVNAYFGIPATGIDVIPTFISRARKIAKQMNLTNIRFIKENISWLTMEEMGQGTIFYMASTTFEDDQLTKIALRLEMLPIGTRLITLSDELPSEMFRITQVKEYLFSWGKTEVYFHEKIA